MNSDASTADFCVTVDILTAFLDGSLPPERSDAVASHIAVCPRCASSLREIAPHGATASDVAPGNLTSPLTPASNCADSPRPASAQLRSIYGSYEVFERLGRGGMGLVFRARHIYLNRPAALKLLRLGPHADAEARARFAAEGQAIARLDHPHIVRVYDFGEEGDEPYFAMELLAGGNLAERLADGPFDPRAAAALVEPLARAADYAHRQGVVHRDLKPANVLLQRTEIERPAAATSGLSSLFPKVADFGLARLLDADSATRSDAVLGTASYMSPEQARGDARAVGTAADVYGLGAILYECLTGRPPFKAATRSETLALVQRAEPARPSALRPGVPAALEAVVLKCLEKRPTDRYPSAEALADDLARWLRGEPVSVRPPGWAIRTVRRYPKAISAGIAVLATALLGAVFWPDPNAPIKRIEARLRAMHEVPLIPATGPPAWHKVRLGGNAAQAALAPGGQFEVHAFDPTLVELIRDPQHDHYRLRAEVRQRAGEDSGYVGLYVCHRETPGHPVPVHSCLQVEFADAIDMRVLLARPPAGVQVPPGEWRVPAGNPFQLIARVVRVRSGDSQPSAAILTSPPVIFPAVGPSKAWRTLTIDVRPPRVVATWDDGKTCELALPDAEAEAANPDRTRKVMPEGLPPAAQRFPARGGLGLVVRRASAAFRNVTLTPLKPTDP
ncbi:MAG: protein kinase [Gemmataceae bacterium]